MLLGVPINSFSLLTKNNNGNIHRVVNYAITNRGQLNQSFAIVMLADTQSDYTIISNMSFVKIYFKVECKRKLGWIPKFFIKPLQGSFKKKIN